MGALSGNQQGSSDLLGGLMDMLSGGDGAGSNQMLSAALQLVQSYPGGVGGLLEAFQNGGLGEIASSWVSTGSNLPVSADQLQNVLGAEQIGAIAQQFGMS